MKKQPKQPVETIRNGMILQKDGTWAKPEGKRKASTAKKTKRGGKKKFSASKLIAKLVDMKLADLKLKLARAEEKGREEKIAIIKAELLSRKGKRKTKKK